MQFFTTLFATLFVLAAPALAVKVTYDNTYDNAKGSLATVSCSNGKNGLLTKGFNTFGDLPTFPNIGGAQAVAGWDSPNCGTCWQLTYKGKSINVLAVDHAGEGFNIAQKALDKLTNNQAVDLGFIQADAKQVPKSHCGLVSQRWIVHIFSYLSSSLNYFLVITILNGYSKGLTDYFGHSDFGTMLYYGCNLGLKRNRTLLQ